jgi:hypothetical protein
MAASGLLNGFGIASVIGLVVGAFFLLALIGIVGLFVIVVVASRTTPDSGGRRAYCVYLLGVAFTSVWITLLGTAVVTASLVQLIGSHHGGGVFAIGGASMHPIGDAAARSATVGGLFAVVAGIICIMSLRRGLALVASAEAGGPLYRVAQTYGAVVSFIAVLVIIVALVMAGYSVAQLAAPGVFLSPARVPALRHLLDSGYVAIAAGIILAVHLRVTPVRLPGLGTAAASDLTD